MAKLKMMCARSMHEAVGALAQASRTATGHEIEFDFGTVGALQKLDAGETADVLILVDPGDRQAGEGGRAGRRLAASDVATTCIARLHPRGRADAGHCHAEAFKQALVKAPAPSPSAIAAVGGSAGVYLAGMFERMGLAAMMKRKGPAAAERRRGRPRVVEGKAEFGLTLSGEVASVEGAVIAGPLPPPFGQDTIYCAAVMAASAAKEAARPSSRR